MLVMAAFTAQAQGNYRITGTVKDNNGAPIPFATAILTMEGGDRTGAVSNQEGEFVLSAPAGRYRLSLSFVGYESSSMEIEVNGDTSVGLITLATSVTDIEAVTVTAGIIRHEGDRFVVSVANSPVAVGKTVLEMLSQSPGVWVSNDNISINGQGGTQIYINDRLLNMTFEELEIYLGNMNAEDLQRIEVIPIAGAEYDASAQGGVIKLTTKRQRDNGLDGSFTLSGSYGEFYRGFAPRGNFSYRENRLTVYGELYGDKARIVNRFDGWTNYFDSDRRTESKSTITDIEDCFGTKLGTIFDINPHHSIGIEGTYHYDGMKLTTDGESCMRGDIFAINNKSYYVSKAGDPKWGATVNYIATLNDHGSQMKIIGDYFAKRTGTLTNSRNTIIDPNTWWLSGSLSGPDSIYRSDIKADFNVYSLTANFDLPLHGGQMIKTGGKLNYNTNISSSLYEWQDAGSGMWMRDYNQSMNTDYRERISALYFIYDRPLPFGSLSVGLRAEHTNVNTQTHHDDGTQINEYEVKQDYLTLFPTANLSIPLDKFYNKMVVLTYNRTVSRPPFHYLNPYRVQISEYAYTEGNPYLKPTFTSNFNLTGVYKQRYTLTLGVQDVRGNITQVGVVDDNNPDAIVFQFENTDRETNYLATLNAPVSIGHRVQFTSMAIWTNQNITIGENKRRNNLFIGQLTSIVEITHDLMFELSGNYMSRLLSGNMVLEPMYNMNASLKMIIAEGKGSITLACNNILRGGSDARIMITEPTFENYFHQHQNYPLLNLTMRMRFSAGRGSGGRVVESGSAEEAARMGSSAVSAGAGAGGGEDHDHDHDHDD